MMSATESETTETRHLPTSVLRQSGIIIVDDTSVRVKYNVLEDRAELDGVEDIRLLLRR